MPKLILHAGMPKTGSTTIQDTLSRDTWNNVLSARRLTYLKHPSISCRHAKYIDSLMGRPRWRGAAEHQRYVARFTQAIHEAQNAIQNDASVLISAETVGAIARSRGNSTQIKDFFSRFFSDVILIVYIREPLSYMYARLQQALKNGQPLDAALHNAIASAHYTAAIRNLEAMFGHSNVTVRSTDPGILTNNDIVTDFCLGALGMENSAELQRLIEDRSDLNFSLPAELIGPLMLMYRNRSISPRNCCSRFVETISAIRWAGNKFEGPFLPRESRRQMLAAADTARAEILEYLGYDCFPSYRPDETHSGEYRTVQEDMIVFRENIELLRKAINDVGEQPNTANSKHASERGAHDIQTRDEARKVAHDLLNHLYELCDTGR